MYEMNLEAEDLLTRFLHVGRLDNGWGGNCPVSGCGKPAFHLTEDGKIWYCEACGNTGSVQDLVGRLRAEEGKGFDPDLEDFRGLEGLGIVAAERDNRGSPVMSTSEGKTSRAEQKRNVEDPSIESLILVLGLEERPGNRWVGDCPLCKTAGELEFYKISNLWFCFKCKFQGNMQDFIEKLRTLKMLDEESHEVGPAETIKDGPEALEDSVERGFSQSLGDSEDVVNENIRENLSEEERELIREPLIEQLGYFSRCDAFFPRERLVFALIVNQGGLRASELSSLINCSDQNIHRTLRTLEKRGIVKKEGKRFRFNADEVKNSQKRRRVCGVRHNKGAKIVKNEEKSLKAEGELTQ